jgi:hypothetical protein
MLGAEFAIFLGATYEVGDGTDNWCRINTTVHENFLQPSVNDPVECGGKSLVISKNIKSGEIVSWTKTLQRFVCA